MSDTPRTDAQLVRNCDDCCMASCVDADFARQLERELEETERLYAELSEALVGDKMLPPIAEVARLQRELAEARKYAERYKGAYEAAIAFVDSHAADPDITPKMCETYAALEVHRAAIENTSSPQGKG